MSDELRIVLVGAAKAAHDQMLGEMQGDKRISINSSRLINWIVLDYCQRYFPTRKKQLTKAHFNERKCLLAAMRIEDLEERRRALQEAARSLIRASNLQPKKARKTAFKNDNEQ